jgi:membrane-bound inhibitor of C-type lysozyme
LNQHQQRTVRTARNLILAMSLTPLTLMLGACGSVNLWPFGGESQGRPRVVPNATEYRCPNGSAFHLRMLESGAAWVIYPDREVRLDKSATGAATRFSNGIAVLDINGGEANLSDGPGISYVACKPAAAAAPTKS